MVAAHASQFSPEQQATAKRLTTDFRFFARRLVKIEVNEPGVPPQPLEFNKAQDYLDYAINLMLAEKGWVRIIIVKGRQQGISTYIEMRLFWKAYTTPNTKVCIISHERDSAKALFEKATFAMTSLPKPLVPTPEEENERRLKLPNNSTYMVLTAGSKESGRSQTAHHQHQSERAFFEDAEKIDAGAGQIVALKPGTEVYKESTGNSMNHFHEEVLQALAGKGYYRVVFIPWFWETSYQAEPEQGFQLEHTKEYGNEPLVAQIYKLTMAQMQWRRHKIDELKGLKKFKQEYPCTLIEAFQASGEQFYDTDLVAKARQSKVVGTGPIVFGVDPARDGDRTVIVIRRGRQILEYIDYDIMDQMRLAGILATMIDKYQPAKVFIDYAHGYGTVDRLRERGYGEIVEGVQFGEGAMDDVLYLNKRAEMAHHFNDWLKDGDVRIPDSDDMAADIASMPEPVPTSNSRLKFPSKKEIKKNYGRSPDILDAILLTFAYPVRPVDSNTGGGVQQVKVKQAQKGSSLRTLRRARGNAAQLPQRRAA